MYSAPLRDVNSNDFMEVLMKSVTLALLIITCSVTVVFAQNDDVRLNLNLLEAPSNDGWAIVNDGNLNAYLDLATREPPPRLLVKLGMSLKQIDSSVIYDHLPLEEGTGMIVDTLVEDLPAEQAGVSLRGIVAKVNGKPVHSTAEFVEFYEGTESDEVEIEFIQKGKVKKVSLSRTEVEEASKRYLIGVHVDVVPASLAAHLGLKEETGLYVKEVMKDLPAGKAGLKPGDILMKIEDESVSTVQELNQKIQKAGARVVVLELLRRGDTVMIEVTPAEDDSYLQIMTANSGNREILAFPNLFYSYSQPGENQDTATDSELSAVLEELVKEVTRLREVIEKKQ